MLPGVIYLSLGLLSLVLMAIAEWATYKHIRFLKPFFWLTSTLLALYAAVMAWIDSPRFPFPDILSAIAWVPLVLCIGLFIYSVFIEIPHRTYIVPHQKTSLVTEGTYTLCRHPAALWYTGALISAVFASKSLILAVSTPLWLLAYVGVIYLEERWTCRGDLGAEYRAWQKVSPMFIPDRAGIRRFRKHLKSGFKSGGR